MHNMKHFDESMLEKYLLNCGALEATLKRDIEGHLATCEECTRIFAFLEAFYTELAQKRREGTTTQVKNFLNKAFPKQATIIRLFPFKPEIQPMPNAPAVLAAKSESERSKKIRKCCGVDSRTRAKNNHQ